MRDLVDQVPWRSAIAAALATAARITKETKSAIMATTWPLKAESFEGETRPRRKKPLWFGFQAPAGMRQAAVFDSPSVFRPFSPLHAHHAHHGRCPPDCQKRPPQTNARGAPPGPLRVCRQSMSAVSPSANHARADNPPARLAANQLFSLSEYQNARRISVYLSMPSGELSTSAIVHDALKSGKQVFIPYIHSVEQPAASPKTSIMEMLALESVEEFESLERDKWGIPSLKPAHAASKLNCFGGQGVAPRADETTREHGLDLIVMPGMAFDQKFRRLGHGKGYYDHFLTRYSKDRDTATPKMPFLGKTQPHYRDKSSRNEPPLTAQQLPSVSRSKCFPRSKISPFRNMTGPSMPSSLETASSSNGDMVM